MTKEEILLEVLDNCFGMAILLNDTFYYASADAEEIEAEDIRKLMPVFEKYGVRDTLVAYAAVVRGHDPKIERNITNNFIEAKKKILELAAQKKIMQEKISEALDNLEVSKDFDGEMPKTYSYTTTLLKNKIVLEDGRKLKSLLTIMKLKSGLFAAGGSYRDAQRRLKVKFDRNKVKNRK